MYKLILLVKSVPEQTDFTQLFIDQYVEKILDLPGVLKCNVNPLTLAPTSKQVIDQEKGLISLPDYFLQIEIYYESELALVELLSDPYSLGIAEEVISKAQGQIHIYLAKEFSFHKNI